MIDIHDIENKFNEALHMPLRPDPEKFANPKEDAVLDENQTVVWNRNEVARLREEYAAERKRLIDESSAKQREAEDLGKKYIMENINNMTEKGAQIIWNYIWDRHHCSIANLLIELDEFLDMFDEVFSGDLAVAKVTVGGAE